MTVVAFAPKKKLHDVCIETKNKRNEGLQYIEDEISSWVQYYRNHWKSKILLQISSLQLEQSSDSLNTIINIQSKSRAQLLKNLQNCLQTLNDNNTPNEILYKTAQWKQAFQNLDISNFTWGTGAAQNFLKEEQIQQKIDQYFSEQFAKFFDEEPSEMIFM